MTTTDTQDAGKAKLKPAKFRFRNIGPVKDAELELGDLTVIAGRNNTGKTYMVYTLYGFLKMWDDWPYADDLMLNQSQAQFPDMCTIAKKVKREGKATLPLDPATLQTQRQTLIQEVASSFSEQALPQVFSSRRGDFKRSTLEVKVDQGFDSDIYRELGDFTTRGPLSIEFDGTNLIVKSSDNERKIPELASHIAHSLLSLLT